MLNLNGLLLIQQLLLLFSQKVKKTRLLLESGTLYGIFMVSKETINFLALLYVWSFYVMKCKDQDHINT